MKIVGVLDCWRHFCEKFFSELLLCLFFFQRGVFGEAKKEGADFTANSNDNK